MPLIDTAAKPQYLLPRTLIYWLPIAFATTVLSLLVYAAVQQDYRQSANDPQIQIAEDAAVQLEAGQSPQTLNGTTEVDLAKSLAPFLIIYDDRGSPVVSSAQLNGQTPTLPPGVFTTVRQSGEDRLTWQPQDGVREAAVVLHFGGSTPGFVLAGRSLLEVEKRESQLTLYVLFAWIIAMVGSLLAWAFALAMSDRLLSRRKA